MAHEVTATDKVAYHGEMPWHKTNCVELPGLATSEEAIIAANLGWEVRLDPAQRNGADVPNYFWTVRDDTDTALGIVTSRYQPVQNREAFKFFDDVCQDPHGPKFVTAGSLFGGKKIWMLAKMPDIITVAGHDVVEEYLLLTNTHNASEKLSVLWTPVRVVCNNTLTLALRTRGGGWDFRHTGGITSKIEEAQDALGILRANHEHFSEALQTLVHFEPTEEQIDMTIAKLFVGKVTVDPDKPIFGEDEAGIEGEEVISTRLANIRSEVKELVYSGIGNDADGVRGTGWAFLNGVTEYVDHRRTVRVSEGRDRDDARLQTIWYGSGAQTKAAAFKEILKLASH